MAGELSFSQRAGYDAWWIAAHFLGEDRARRWFRPARAWLDGAIARELAQRGPGGLRPIDRRRDLTPREFATEYLIPGRPVLLEGAASGWGSAGWTPEGLAARYPDDEVLLIAASREDLASPRGGADRVTMTELVRDMRAGKKTYARFNPLLQRHPELVADLDTDWLRARVNRLHASFSYQLFMGPVGSTTAIHCAITNNLFVETYGEKRWLLYSPAWNPVFQPPIQRSPYFFSRLDPEAPDLSRYPLFPHVEGYEVILRAGDVLFNPSFWWHQVTNLTDTIGVGFRWFSPWNMLRSSPTQSLLTFCATNPPVWVARRHRQDFSKIFAETRPPAGLTAD